MGATCPEENSENIDQGSFWDANGINWDNHRVGWALAGGCAVLTVAITMISVLLHCRNYTNRREQRQIIRILYMPPVYAIISFFSYRYFRDYTYYSLIEVAYEAITLSAFLLLLIEYVAATAIGHTAENAIQRKDKRKLPIPFCCWRYRPTKAYFMYTVKWSVLQYVIIRPAVTITGIICEVYGVLCESGGFNLNSVHFANIYLQFIDFISISIALYGLLLFYGLVKEELKGRRPLAKFLAIKLIVMATFYQSFIFTFLSGPGHVIHATTFWTATNIAHGLNALAICIEMVFFALFMWWAYSPNEYLVPGAKKTSIWRPLWDSINYTDFAIEIFGSFRYFFTAARGKPVVTRPGNRIPVDEDGKAKMNFGEAFGVSQNYTATLPIISAPHMAGESTTGLALRPRRSYDENIRLAPYTYPNRSRSGDSLPSPNSPTGQDFTYVR